MLVCGTFYPKDLYNPAEGSRVMTRKTRYFMAGSAAIVVAGLCTGLAAYYGGGFPSLSASRSGPAELSYVPADATVLAFANVGEIMNSEVRQKLKAALPHETGQQEFEKETGIDIERDIQYVVAAMTAPGPSGMNSPNGLVVARGQFNPAQLEGLAREHGGVVEEYKGKRLVKVSDNKPDHVMALAFLEPGLVGIGSETAIKSSIDAQLTAHSITSNNDMMELVSQIDNGNNAWAVGRVDVLTSQAKLPNEIASKLPAVKTFAVMTHIDGGVSGTLRAEARDQASADNLRQVVQGALALGRMSNDPKATAFINSLQLSGSGNTVALSFTIPIELFDMLPNGIKKGDAGMHLHELPKELHDLKAPEAPKPPQAPRPPRPDR